jgi:hypothetical protein
MLVNSHLFNSIYQDATLLRKSTVNVAKINDLPKLEKERHCAKLDKEGGKVVNFRPIQI